MSKGSLPLFSHARDASYMEECPFYPSTTNQFPCFHNQWLKASSASMSMTNARAGTQKNGLRLPAPNGRTFLTSCLINAHSQADRVLYKAMVTDQTLALGLRLQVQRLFETEMPKDSAPSRVHNRCVLTGRPRSVHRFCRLSRIMIRQLAHYGQLPGVSKSSWGSQGSSTTHAKDWP